MNAAGREKRIESIEHAQPFEGCHVVILCHSDKRDGKRASGSGPLEPLLHFFLKNKARYIFVIEQPHLNRNLSAFSSMEVYRDGTLVEEHIYEGHQWLYVTPPEKRGDKLSIRYKLRDILAARHFFRIIRKCYSDCDRIHYLFGVESINALLGHAARRLLNIRDVVYYIFDWSPHRYPSRILSAMFLFLDRWACRKSDFIWNVTDAIAETRKTLRGYSPGKMGVQITVPYGAPFREELVRDLEDLEKYKVIFTGGHYEDNGVSLLPEIARRIAEQDEKIHLVVTSEGPLTEDLKGRISAYGLRNTTFTGHIPDPRDLDRLMCECVIGLAPFPETLKSTKRYGDVIKIRSYFACGLVVVSTNVPPAAREIEREHLGLVTSVDAVEMAEAVLSLCSDENRLREYRDNVISKARDHSWEKIYERTLLRMTNSHRA